MGTELQDIGYLATPTTPNGKGIVVLQEWWGLVPDIKQIADRFASVGYTALAPDLYHGKQTTAPDEAGRMLMALNIEQAAQDLQAAIDQLLQQDSVTHPQAGVVGFCMGGQLALLAATISPAIGAAVDFYGIHPKVNPDFSRLVAPVLGLFAEADTFVPPATVRQLEAQIRAAGGTIETHIYPEVGHGFFNSTNASNYNATAAEDAWTRTIGFLQQHLTVL